MVCRILLPAETEIVFLAWVWEGEMERGLGTCQACGWREGSRPWTGEGRLGYKLPFIFTQVRIGRLRPKVNALRIKAQDSWTNKWPAC